MVNPNDKSLYQNHTRLFCGLYCAGDCKQFCAAFFQLAGIQNWKILALLWAVVPLGNALVFTRVPIAPLIEEGQQGMTLKELFGKKLFWLFVVMMICAGASEQGMSQWASMFAEEGLGVSKTVGDLLGPCLFAVLMGSSRAFYGKFGEKINLQKFMLGSGALCIISYLLAVVKTDSGPGTS